MKNLTVCITGASGSIYGKRIVEVLVSNGYFVNLIFSKIGEEVFEFETGLSKERFLSKLPENQVKLYNQDDLFAPISSGSYFSLGTIVAPCSAGTLGAIASGSTRNLIHRVVDVCLKERRKVLLLFRETPLNRIHIENMLKVTDAGAIVMPACPGFYSKPESIDDIVNFVVGKALNTFFENDFKLFKSWNPEDS